MTTMDLNESPILSAFAFDGSDDSLVEEVVEFLEDHGVKDLVVWQRSGTLRMIVLGPPRCRMVIEEFEGETCSVPDLVEDMRHNSNFWIDPITDASRAAADQAESKYEEWLVGIWGSGQSYTEEKESSDDNLPKRHARRGGRQRSIDDADLTGPAPAKPEPQREISTTASQESVASVADRIIRAAKGEATGGVVVIEE